MEQVRTVKVRYSIDALNHISAIHTYIDARNPAAATRVVAQIRTAAERLGTFPEQGRVGIVVRTHEWVVTGLPYIIVYEPDFARDELIILGVYHGAQLRPGSGER